MMNIDFWKEEMEDFEANLISTTATKANQDKIFMMFCEIMQGMLPGVNWVDFLLRLKFKIPVTFRFE